jgi:small subunit ribosomal protein S16
MKKRFVANEYFSEIRSPFYKQTMATKIRLQRHGKKGKAFFHIVVADGRAPRDGRFIEKIGTYNPVTNPATIDINFDRALYWVGTGATPTDTARAILSYKGVMMKDHLLRGVKKGAMTTEQAEAKFQTWFNSKEAGVAGKIKSLADKKKAAYEARMADESSKKLAREQAIAAKNTPAPAEEAPSAEATPEETNTSEGDAPAEA